MRKTTYLKIIAWISLAGMLFSGYLSYSELFADTCRTGTCSLVKGVPACVYGLIMYTLMLVLSLLALGSKK